MPLLCTQDSGTAPQETGSCISPAAQPNQQLPQSSRGYKIKQSRRALTSTWCAEGIAGQGGSSPECLPATPSLPDELREDAEAAAEAARGRFLGKQLSWGTLSLGDLSSPPSEPRMPPCMAEDTFLLHRGSCLSSAPRRSLGELLQGLCSLCGQLLISYRLG